jgi:hypothetical protein
MWGAHCRLVGSLLESPGPKPFFLPHGGLKHSSFHMEAPPFFLSHGCPAILPFTWRTRHSSFHMKIPPSYFHMEALTILPFTWRPHPLPFTWRPQPFFLSHRDLAILPFTWKTQPFFLSHRCLAILPFTEASIILPFTWMPQLFFFNTMRPCHSFFHIEASPFLLSS